jgi:hypothetical protein
MTPSDLSCDFNLCLLLLHYRSIAPHLCSHPRRASYARLLSIKCLHCRHCLHYGHGLHRFQGSPRRHGLHRFHGLHLSILHLCSANALLAQILFCCICCLCYRVSLHRVASPNCSTLTLSTLTTCMIWMQILATVQRSALSNISKSQLYLTLGT